MRRAISAHERPDACLNHSRRCGKSSGTGWALLLWRTRCRGTAPPVAWPAAPLDESGGFACRSVPRRGPLGCRTNGPPTRPSTRPPDQSTPTRLRAAQGQDRNHRRIVLVGDLDGDRDAVGGGHNDGVDVPSLVVQGSLDLQLAGVPRNAEGCPIGAAQGVDPQVAVIVDCADRRPYVPPASVFSGTVRLVESDWSPSVTWSWSGNAGSAFTNLPQAPERRRTRAFPQGPPTPPSRTGRRPCCPSRSPWPAGTCRSRPGAGRIPQRKRHLSGSRLPGNPGMRLRPAD